MMDERTSILQPLPAIPAEVWAIHRDEDISPGEKALSLVVTTLCKISKVMYPNRRKYDEAFEGDAIEEVGLLGL